MTQSNLADQILKLGSDFLSWAQSERIGAALAREQVASGREATTAASILKAQGHRFEARAELMKIGRLLAADLKHAGRDPSTLLDFLHCIDSGGGPEVASHLWRDLNVQLQLLVVAPNLRPSAGPGPALQQPQCNHSSDFVSVKWYGTNFEFAKGHQAEAVRVLWTEWAKGGLALSEKTIGDEIDSQANHFRLVDVFRRRDKAGKHQTHPAWRAMIEPVGKGKFRLAERKNLRTTK